MKRNKALLSITSLLVISFIFIWGCKSLSSDKKAEEIIEDQTEETSNVKEDGDEKEYLITESEYFEMPDKIILYNKGKQIFVEKNTESYNKIVYLTNERFKTDCGMAEEAISDEFVEDIKDNKFAIEFIYIEEKQTIYICEGYHYKKNYTKILFPLPNLRAIFGESEYEYQEYQGGPWRVSIQPESDYLIAIIEEEFGKQ